MEVAMKAKLGPGRNESQAGGWMSVDSGQVEAAVGFWGQSFWQVGVQERKDRDTGDWAGVLIRNLGGRRPC